MNRAAFAMKGADGGGKKIVGQGLIFAEEVLEGLKCRKPVEAFWHKPRKIDD